MAQVFNVSVDYLLIDDAERRPRPHPKHHVDARLADLDQLADEERASRGDRVVRRSLRRLRRLPTGRRRHTLGVSVSQAHDELVTRLDTLDQLSDADCAALLHILDGQLANALIRASLDNAG